jgi:hypothetical protein
MAVLIYDHGLAGRRRGGFGSERAGRSHAGQNDVRFPPLSLAVTVDQGDNIFGILFHPGDVTEPDTFGELLEALGPPAGTTMVMDGFTDANIRLMSGRKLHYFSRSPKKRHDFDRGSPDAAAMTAGSGGVVSAYRTERSLTADDGSVLVETLVRCLTPGGEAMGAGPVPVSKTAGPGAYILAVGGPGLTDRQILNMHLRVSSIDGLFEFLKADLGYRPGFNQAERRGQGYHFISVLAYRCVNFIRKRPEERGIHDGWEIVANDLRNHISSRTAVISVTGAKYPGVSYEPERCHQRIYDALGLSPTPRVLRRLW